MQTEGVRRMVGRPRVLAVLPQLIPSTILTVVKPLTGLHRAKQIVADIGLERYVSRHRVERADVVVFCRNTEPLYGPVLDTAVALGRPIIYELDDNYFEFPLSYEGGRYHRDPARLAQLERYLRSASLVRVHSELLREYVERYNPRAVRVDGPIDWSLAPHAPPYRDPRVVRVVYATSRTEDHLVTLFLQDMRELLTTYRGRVELFFWGYHPPELTGDASVHCLKFMPDYDCFFKQLAASGFDVGLAPLGLERFYRSKSNNKFREYAACRIAGVYSDVEVYSECVRDGKTGLLVSNAPGGWFGGVSRLVEDPVLRRKIQDEAYSFARRRYSLGKVQESWVRHIEEVLAEVGASARMKMVVFEDGCGREGTWTGMLARPGLVIGWFAGIWRWGRRSMMGVKVRGVRPTLRVIQWQVGQARAYLHVRRDLWRTVARESRRRSGGEFR